MSVNNINEFLKEQGIKPSYQRIRIYEYLINTKKHPTADKIYSDLIDQIPTLSKTTVYNTMELFKEKGIVMQITIDENEARFDADTSMHGHFQCSGCNEVKDFSVEIKNDEEKMLVGNLILSKQVFYYGICEKCNKADN